MKTINPINLGSAAPWARLPKWKGSNAAVGFKYAVAAFAALVMSAFASLATAPGRSYVYDAEGRLVQATISDGTTTTQITYTYDTAGNLTSVSEQQLN